MKFNIITVICISVLLTGCVSTAKTEQMVATNKQAQAQVNSKFFEKLSVGNITVNIKTNKRAESQISQQALKAALKKSLENNSYISNSSAALYRIDAELETFEQVDKGFDVPIKNILDVTVKSVISYSIYEISSSKQVFKSEIESYYTAEISEAFAGIKRVRLANEGSLRNNIALLIQKLNNVSARIDF